MNKLLLVIVFLVATASGAVAQPTHPAFLTIGADGAVPTGEAADFYSAGLGFSAELNVPASSKLYGLLTAGYEVFFVKSSVVGSGNSYGVVPFKVGLKYYVVHDFFVDGQVAAVPATDGSSTAFGYSLGLGYVFTKRIEAGLRYEGWQTGDTFEQFALRVAYRFARDPKPKK